MASGWRSCFLLAKRERANRSFQSRPPVATTHRRETRRTPRVTLIPRDPFDRHPRGTTQGEGVREQTTRRYWRCRYHTVTAATNAVAAAAALSGSQIANLSVYSNNSQI